MHIKVRIAPQKQNPVKPPAGTRNRLFIMLKIRWGGLVSHKKGWVKVKKHSPFGAKPFDPEV